MPSRSRARTSSGRLGSLNEAQILITATSPLCIARIHGVKACPRLSTRYSIAAFSSVKSSKASRN